MERRNPPLTSLVEENTWYRSYVNDLHAEIDRLEDIVNATIAQEDTDFDQSVFTKMKANYRITKGQYAIMAYLARLAGILRNRSQISKATGVAEGAVSVQISTLNSHFPERVVDSIQGVGYRITQYGHTIMERFKA